MSDNMIGQALDDISDVYLESAMGVYERKRKGRKIRLRLTACAVVLALLLTAVLWPEMGGTENPQIVAIPGVIQVHACEMVDTGNGNITVKTDSSLDIGAMATQNTILLPYMTTSGGLGVKLELDEAQLQGCQISFDISCNYGALFTWEKVIASDLSSQVFMWECHEQTLTIQNGGLFYWRANHSSNVTTDESRVVLRATDGIYTKVTVRADGNIVGYAIFEMINMDPQMLYFGITMRESVFYPKVDGQFQAITEEYIQEQMQKHTLKPMAGTEVALGGVYHSARGPQESVDIAFLSASNGIRYTCNIFDGRYADREITFDFSANGGYFAVGKTRCTGTFTVGNDSVLVWKSSADTKQIMQNDGAIFVDVIIRADGQVIGYAVIQIGYAHICNPETGEIGDAIGYAAASCHSVCYPPVDGQLPDLTEEQARAKIEEYKQAQRSQDTDPE